MALFFVTVPTKAYEVELRVKEAVASMDVTVDEGSWADLYERFMDEPYEGQPIREPDTFILRTTTGNSWEVTVADDYMEILENSVSASTYVSSGGHSGTFISRVSNNSQMIRTVEDKIKAEIVKYFLEKHLMDTLEKFALNDAMSNYSYDFNVTQALFTVPIKDADGVINRLQSAGIGVRYESSITVCPSSVYYSGRPNSEDGDDLANLNVNGSGDTGRANKSSIWQEFVKSIKSRLTVAQVVSEIRQGALITFDFVVFAFIAAVLCSIGLLEDSVVTLVSSMLISPLIGPIMAITFGTNIRDGKLMKLGIAGEAIGLSICFITGYFTGVCLGSEAFEGPWSNISAWPTKEMIARGQLRDVFLTVVIAVPSGVALALSLLDGSAGILIGVGLTPALLLPSVACGLFWGVSTAIWIREGINRGVWFDNCSTMLGNTSTGESKYFRKYQVNYCDNAVREFLLLGLVAISMIVITITLIYVMALIVLRIKEFAPYASQKNLRRFWKEDLPQARKYNINNRTHNQGFSDHESILEDINSSNNPDEVRRYVDEDNVFREVNRNLRRPPVSQLDDFKVKTTDSAEKAKASKELGTSLLQKDPKNRESFGFITTTSKSKRSRSFSLKRRK